MADDKTPHYKWPLPSAENLLSEDVGRIRDSLSGIDTALHDEKTAREAAIQEESAARAAAITAEERARPGQGGTGSPSEKNSNSSLGRTLI